MKKNIIISVISVFCLYSCLSYIDAIQIINHSDYGQIVCYTCSDSIGSEIDSLTFNPYFKQYDYFKYEILKKDAYIDRNSSQWLKTPFPKEYITQCCEDGLIRFFFIKDSVFLNNPWDTIVKYQMYNKKLVLSEEDLKNMNWIIEYK